MMDLVSIHIPKTAGTSFYHILKQQYGNNVSISYKRRHYKEIIAQTGDFYQSLSNDISVVHGHLYYQEVKSIHYSEQPKIITWLRDPADRVNSNYKHFIKNLNSNNINSANYKINKHRRNETLIQYARLEENRNRMSKFLQGLDLRMIFFIGFLESFSIDVNILAQKLGWPNVEVPKLNSADHTLTSLSENDRRLIESWNQEDTALYNAAMELRACN